MSGLAALLRRSGATVECAVTGESMGRAVPHGSVVRIRCDGGAGATNGDVIAILLGGALTVHRVIHRGRSERARGWIVAYGDNNLTCDAPLPPDQVIGPVLAVRSGDGGDWHPPGPRTRHRLLREWLTASVNGIICALLEVDPGIALKAKGAVVFAMKPLVWLRPYDKGSVPTASVAHRQG